MKVLTNATLLTVYGLDNLVYVGGTMDISGNGLLGAASFANVTTAENLYIEENAYLTDIDLSSLVSVTGSVDIFLNAQLADLQALSSLIQVDGSLTIESNSLLASVDGLEALTSVGSNLTIEYNDALTSISGLSAFESTGSRLYIRYNGALCASDVSSFVGGVTVGSDLKTSDNASC